MKPPQRFRWWLAVLCVVLAVLAVTRLARQAPRLAWGEDGPGSVGAVAAVDLKMRVEETRAWFGGAPAYAAEVSNYPPAAYLFFWPIIGWNTLASARLAWMALLLLSLAMTSRFAWHFLAGASPDVRVLGVILVWSIFPTSYAFSAGQLGPLLLLALLNATAALERQRSLGKVSWLAAAWTALSLIKPSYSIGWFVALPFMGRGFGVAIRAAAIFGVACLAALPFPSGSFVQRLFGWVGNGTQFRGTGNLARLVARPEWVLPAAGLFLLAFVVWLALARPDVWDAAAVAAIASRWAVYHAPVDDGLLLIPLLVLLRHVNGGTLTPVRRRVALCALGIGLVALHLPTRLHSAGGTQESVFLAAQTLAFASSLAFFVTCRRIG